MKKNILLLIGIFLLFLIGTIPVEANSVFLSIDGGSYAGSYLANEIENSKPIADLPSGMMAGSTRYIGMACTAGTFSSATAQYNIAVIQRGYCTYREKTIIARDAGYVGVIIFNNAVSLTGSMGNPPLTDISAVMIGESTGFAIFEKTNLADLNIDDLGQPIKVTAQGIGIPEFPTMALPIAAVIGLLFLFQRRKG